MTPGEARQEHSLSILGDPRLANVQAEFALYAEQLDVESRE